MLEQRGSIKRNCKQLMRPERYQLYTSGLGKKRPAVNNGLEQAEWKWFEEERKARREKPS